MKTEDRIVHLLGYASGLGGVNPECAQGPFILQKSRNLNRIIHQLAAQGWHSHWDAILRPSLSYDNNRLEGIKQLCYELSLLTAHYACQKEFFIVNGGDHTSAIGTWSGVTGAKLGGPLGLIWIDAHMDSHTPETSVTGRYHGMSLACLLGYGDASLTQLHSPQPKIKPEHLCLIGVRSYEQGEAELLKKLGVCIYFMEEVKDRGLLAVFKEALALVTRATVGFGLSLDIDSIDPQEAPGVDVPEPNGLKVKDLVQALSGLALDPRLLGVEIVEFNPHKDHRQLTENAIIAIIQAILLYTHHTSKCESVMPARF